MRPQVPDYLELFCFVLFCFGCAHQLMCHRLRITRILFLFLLIADNPCLVLGCLICGIFCQGAHIFSQQLSRPWQIIPPWPSCSWFGPSLREPWRALVLLVISMRQAVQIVGNIHFGVLGFHQISNILRALSSPYEACKLHETTRI